MAGSQPPKVEVAVSTGCVRRGTMPCMSLLVQQDTTAHALLLGGVVVAAGSEVVATYLGQARDGQRRLSGSVSEALLLRKRSGGSAADRWTKQVLVGTILAGLLVASLLASREPGVRAYANNWTTLVLGLALVASGRCHPLVGRLDARSVLPARGDHRRWTARRLERSVPVRAPSGLRGEHPHVRRVRSGDR